MGGDRARAAATGMQEEGGAGQHAVYVYVYYMFTFLVICRPGWTSTRVAYACGPCTESGYTVEPLIDPGLGRELCYNNNYYINYI